MALVTNGLGQPESGAIVAGGLGAAEADPNRLRAILAGSSAILATLTDGSTPTEPTPTGTGRGYYYYTPPERIEPKPLPGVLVAHLHGAGDLTGRIDFALDPEWLAAQLADALLLDLV